MQALKKNPTQYFTVVILQRVTKILALRLELYISVYKSMGWYYYSHKNLLKLTG